MAYEIFEIYVPGSLGDIIVAKSAVGKRRPEIFALEFCNIFPDRANRTKTFPCFLFPPFSLCGTWGYIEAATLAQQAPKEDLTALVKLM